MHDNGRKMAVCCQACLASVIPSNLHKCNKRIPVQQYSSLHLAPSVGLGAVGFSLSLSLPHQSITNPLWCREPCGLYQDLCLTVKIHFSNVFRHYDRHRQRCCRTQTRGVSSRNLGFKVCFYLQFFILHYGLHL